MISAPSMKMEFFLLKNHEAKAKIIVVMPAFNAEKTLKKTVEDIPKDWVSEIILVDDCSTDGTVEAAKELGLATFVHPNNLGYGGNQKTCYWEALKRDSDIIVMIHPDYQYDSTLLPILVFPILQGQYDMMFGSRIRTRQEALQGGMPIHKYLLNRLYTIVANVILGVNFSEYLSGMRAYSRKTLTTVPFQRFSNDFIFDQQFTLSAISHGLKIGEIPISVRYYEDSSSIHILPGLKFGIESLWLLVQYIAYKMGVHRSKIFQPRPQTHDEIRPNP